MAETLPFGFGPSGGLPVAGLDPADAAGTPDLTALLDVLRRSQGQTAPIWSSSNPVGTERLHETYAGMPMGPIDPVVDPSIARWPGRPMTQSEYQNLQDASTDLFNNAALLEGGGASLPERVALASRRPLANPPPPPRLPFGVPAMADAALQGSTAPGAITPYAPIPGVAPVARQLVPGENARVSTRIPTAVGQQIDPHTRSDLNIGIDAARNSGDAYGNNAGEMLWYPDLPTTGMRWADDVTNASVAHMKDNLIWLHGQMVNKFGQGMVDRAANWYDGANRIATDLANNNGYQPFQVAGAIANLSPQKDWYMNADLGRRLIDIVRNRGEQTLTPEMNDWASGYINNQLENADTPGKQMNAANLQMSLSSLQRGQPLNQINDPDTRALFVRAYDEAHNSRNFPIVTPEGDFGDLQTNQDGSPSNIGWGSFGEIKKALAALEAPDVETVSRTLGGNHKVRSFYNNIISPDAPQGDTTIDTHAVAALHLRPLSGADPVVDNGLGMGGSASNATGAKGMYGINHEAYRQAAEQLGLQPRQLQSITWEGVRGLFSPEQKRDASFYNQNWDIWNGFKNGAYDADTARNMVLQHAGGLRPPSWWTPSPGAPVQ